MLTTPLHKLAYVVIRAREFDAQVEPEGLEVGSNSADDQEIEILESSAGNPTQAELQAALNDLNEDELTEVLALVWLGRGDYDSREWNEAQQAAREALN